MMAHKTEPFQQRRTTKPVRTRTTSSAAVASAGGSSSVANGCGPACTADVSSDAPVPPSQACASLTAASRPHARVTSMQSSAGTALSGPGGGGTGAGAARAGLAAPRTGEGSGRVCC